MFFSLMAAKKGLYSGASKVSKKKTKNAASSLETLQKIKESSRAEHCHQKKEHETTTLAM